MSKYILATATALVLLLAPVATMAQTDNGTGTPEKSGEMKGPPNADGMMKKDGTSNDMKSGRSEDSNGAAAAKSTGADK